MKVIVGTTPHALVEVTRNQTPVIQNLGPGDLYLDFSSTVAVGNGLKVVPDGSYEFLHDLPGRLYLVASQASTDVRILVVN